MKCSRLVMLSVAIVTLLPLAAFARQKNEGTITLFDPVTLGSTRLAPGTYKVEWSGTGSAVEVSVLQNKKTVATTTAELKTNDPQVKGDAVVLRDDSSSAKQVAEIDFGKQKAALVLASAQTSPGAGQ